MLSSFLTRSLAASYAARRRSATYHTNRKRDENEVLMNGEKELSSVMTPSKAREREQRERTERERERENEQSEQRESPDLRDQI